MGHLPPWVQLVFIVALISALFPSADGALTALTASTCIDLLRMPERNDWDEARRHRIRLHLGFALLFMALVLVFRADNASMIGLILKLAGYTYGPLLGLFRRAQPAQRARRLGAVGGTGLAHAAR